jgi:aquaporin Z
MVSACFFGVFLFHPISPLVSLDDSVRNILMGVAMGATAIAIIKSPWGQRSGAHFNPAVTLTFLRLGKIEPLDAVYYILFQFLGGFVGVLISWIILGDLLSNSAVNFVITVPGPAGPVSAFIAEIVISFLMMSMILFSGNHVRFARFTPIFAGILVALFITFESQISGMSMNPARTFASSVVSGNWTGWWIYFAGPPLAMFSAAEFFVSTRGLKRVLCAKLDHFGRARCIFNCGFSMD